MPGVDQLQIESSLGRILNRWPAVGLALGVIRDGALGVLLRSRRGKH